MNIKEKRKSLGLKQREMAEVVNLTVENYNRTEKGTYILTADRQQKAIAFMNDYEKIYNEKVELINYYKNIKKSS